MKLMYENSMRQRFLAGRAGRMLLAVLLAAALATGCIERTHLLATESNTYEITIAHSWGEYFTRSLNEILIAPFEESHPHIKVKVTEHPDISWRTPHQRNVDYLQGPGAPDLVIMDRYIAYGYATEGALTDLNGFVRAANITSSDYYAASWEECQYNGAPYCLPWGMDTILLIYNKTLMSQAGLDPQKPPATIDELDRMTAQLTKFNAQGKMVQTGFVPWRFAYGGLYTLGLMFGGQWERNGAFAPDDPGNVKALDWITSTFDRYDPLVWSEYLEQKTTSFEYGTIGFVFESPWFVQEIANNARVTFDWGVAPLPTLDGQPITWGGGSAVAIPAGVRHTEQAWELLQYLTHKEGDRIWTEENKRLGGIAISAMPAINEQAKLMENEQIAPFLESIPSAVIRPRAFVYMEYWDDLSEVVHKAILKEKPHELLLQELKVKAERSSLASSPTE